MPAYKIYSMDELFQHRFVHVTHTDMDGYGCEVVIGVAKALGIIPEEVEYHSINVGYPGDFVNKVEVFTADHPETETWPLLITDLNATNGILDYLEDTGIPFVLVDHHVTSDEIRKRLKEMSPASTVDTSESATRLLFNKIGFYSSRKLKGPDDVPIVDKLDTYSVEVSRYDTGNWGTWNTESIFSTSPALREQLLFMDTDTEEYVPEVVKQIVLGYNRSPIDMEQVKRQFSLLATYQRLFNDNLMRVDPDCLDKGPGRINKAMAIPITLPYISIISKKYLEEHRDVDVLIILGNKHGNVSLRSIDFNVQQLAASYGGGGHPRAAGFPITNTSLAISFSRPQRRVDMEMVLHPEPILDSTYQKNTN